MTLSRPLTKMHAAGATVQTTGYLGHWQEPDDPGRSGVHPSALGEFSDLYLANATGVELVNLNLDDVTLLGSGTILSNSLVQGNVSNDVTL